MFTILNTGVEAIKEMRLKDELKGWGFTQGAESLNGRLAMIAFTTAIIVELLTGHGFLQFLQLI